MSAELSLNYEYRQNADAPVILFLHGFLGSLNDWREISGALRDDYSILTVDLPGHGKSANVRNMAQAAQAVVSLLDALGIGRLYLYGYSMGGRLSLFLSLFFPRYFIKVILESASPGLRTENERKKRIERDEKLARRFESESMESLLSFWYGLPLFANLRRDPSFDALYKRRLENKGKDAAQSLRTLGTGRQPSLWGKIGENQIPTMLLAGEFDEKFTKISADICQTGRLFEMKIVENCGHTIYIENRQAVIAIIESFFNENAE